MKRGTTLKFVWRGKHPHNVVVASGPKKFHSKMQTKGTFKAKVTKKGTYRIICQIHPGMTLKLKVK